MGSQSKINSTVQYQKLSQKSHSMRFLIKDRKGSNNSISDKEQNQVIKIAGKPMFKIVEDQFEVSQSSIFASEDDY